MSHQYHQLGQHDQQHSLLNQNQHAYPQINHNFAAQPIYQPQYPQQNAAQSNASNVQNIYLAQANLYIEQKNQEFIEAKQKIKKIADPLYYISFIIIGYGLFTLYQNTFNSMSMSTWTNIQFHVYTFDHENEVEPTPKESGGFLFILIQFLISSGLIYLGFKGTQILKPETLSYSYLTKQDDNKESIQNAPKVKYLFKLSIKGACAIFVLMFLGAIFVMIQLSLEVDFMIEQKYARMEQYYNFLHPFDNLSQEENPMNGTQSLRHHEHRGEAYERPFDRDSLERAKEEEMECANCAIGSYVFGRFFWLAMLHLIASGVFSYFLYKLQKLLELVETNPLRKQEMQMSCIGQSYLPPPPQPQLNQIPQQHDMENKVQEQSNFMQ